MSKSRFTLYYKNTHYIALAIFAVLALMVATATAMIYHQDTPQSVVSALTTIVGSPHT